MGSVPLGSEAVRCPEGAGGWSVSGDSNVLPGILKRSIDPLTDSY